MKTGFVLLFFCGFLFQLSSGNALTDQQSAFFFLSFFSFLFSHSNSHTNTNTNKHKPNKHKQTQTNTNKHKHTNPRIRKILHINEWSSLALQYQLGSFFLSSFPLSPPFSFSFLPFLSFPFPSLSFPLPFPSLSLSFPLFLDYKSNYSLWLI